MARIGTSWNEIEPGDIITFKYKSKSTGKSRTQTILVLNPKFVSTRSRTGGAQEKVFHLITTSLTSSDELEFGLISAKYKPASTCEASHCISLNS